jgi:phage tail protein X
MGKTPRADGLAEMGNGLGVAEKVLEAHGLSLQAPAVRQALAIRSHEVSVAFSGAVPISKLDNLCYSAHHRSQEIISR